MNYKYLYLTFFIFLGLATLAHAEAYFLDDPTRNLPEKNAVEVLQLNQYVQLGDYNMQITSLEKASTTAAAGKGQVYIPMLGLDLPVIFSDISVAPTGEMLSGEVRVLTSGIARPTYETPEIEVAEYLRLANNNSRLPHLFSPALEAQGMDFGGHDLVITELVFTEEKALMDAVFLVDNLDGRITTFSKNGIHLNGDNIDFCNLEFPMEGPDQASTDPVLPIIIKGYNKDAPVPLEGDSEEERQAKLKNLGTYVTFSCNGFEQFQLVGEYHFKAEYVTPVETSPLPDKVIATFALTIETWGQFMAEVTFNTPFEVKGLDDVIFSISGAVIDYSDTQNPTRFPSAYFNIDENTGEGIEEFGVEVDSNLYWRGFFIGDMSVKLPESLKIGKAEDGGRIKIAAENLIYESAVGMTANFITFVENSVEKTPIVEGSLEGWKMGVDTVQIKVIHNSFKSFKVAGEIHIPITGEGNEIEYEAFFEKKNDTLQAQFNLKVGGEYKLPFLEGSKLILEETSVVGISSTGSGFKPYANLSGRINVTVNDLNFDGLGFQDLNIPAEEGIGGISIYAFEFAGNTFVTGEATAGEGEGNDLETPTGGEGNDPETLTGGEGNASANPTVGGGNTSGNPTGGEGNTSANPTVGGGNTPTNPTVGEGNASGTPADGEQSEKLKGFPISISDISFGSDETDSNLKRLGFTLKVNFTNPKIGVNAEGSFVVIGEVKPGELVPADGAPYAPWNAFVFKGFELNKLLIDMDMGGIKLVGGVRGFTTPDQFSPDYVFGTGFKGALELTVAPNITVQAVALFGKTPEGGESHRYWFADAKLLLKSGIPIIPGVIGLNGFGGGAYYNMQLTTKLPKFPPAGADENPGENAAWALLEDIPATLSSLRYEPYKPTTGDVIGVKATIVLGTHPNAATANLDLTLDISFNTNPFGLQTVSLNGDAYFMAPIDERKSAKVTASATITYNHTLKLLDAAFTAKVNIEPILTGRGDAAMHFNLNEGQGNDWFIAIGSPPISKRMSLDFEVAGITAGSFNCYFVAGNLNALPADQRRYPLLREYHEELAQFQDEVEEMDMSRAMGGFAILMGAQFSLGPISETWWIFRASAHATAGFDLMLAQMECVGYDEIGIRGWYLQGQAYAALKGGVDVKVDLLIYKGWFDIFSISTAALLQVQLPDPTWMKANVAGRYRILGGLVTGNFEAEFEVGEKCEPIGSPLDAASLIANIKVITDIKPEDYVAAENNRVEIYREKLVVASLSMPIGSVLDFSEESSDGLKIRPVMSIRSINNNVEGTWRYLDEDGNNVGVNGRYVIMEFNSTKLLEANTLYKITLEARWEKKTNASPNWVPVIKDDGNPARDREVRSFMTGPRPEFLPNEAILAQYPEYRDYKHHLLDNPEGGGIAMKLRGWGYLFNPMKKVEGGNDVREYDFFLRVTDLSSNEVAFEEPFTARPEPKWGETYCDEYEVQYSRCQVPSDCSLPSLFGVSLCDFVAAIYGLGALLDVECAENVCVGNQVRQTSKSTSKSNVKNTPNRWGFGGPSYNDLSVPTNSTNYDKAIGFPDFSAVLLPERTYHIELVAVPIPDENYDVREEETVAETISTGSNESYTVTTVARTINQDVDDGGAEEKLIYDYHFRTSKYSQLVDKLKETNWTVTGEWNSGWLSKDDRGVYYAREDFVDYDDIGSYNNYNSVIDLPLGLRSYTAFSHRLQNSSEKYDMAETQRLAKNMELDNSWGYMALPNLPAPIRLTDYSFAKARSIRWPSSNSKFAMSFTSPYFTDKLDQVGKPFIPSYPASNNRGTVTYFYPMLIERYQLMERLSIYDKYMAERNYVLAVTCLFSYITPTRSARANPPPTNLFRLTYSAGPGSTTGSYNVDVKRGQASTGYVDYSGEYYIRNVGSGRYLHEVEGGSSGVVSTTWQPDDQYNRFKLIRRSDGTYKIENKATGRAFSSPGWPDVRSSGGGFYPIKLISQEDGSFKLSLSDGTNFIVENSSTKTLQYKSTNGTYYDYDEFTLESVWETPPVDLNKEYFIRVKTSGRYLSASNNVVSTSSTNDGNQIKFTLRRRAGGYYDITNKATNRRLHYVDDENEGYSTASCSNCEESNYQFLLEEDNNNTSWTTDDDTYRVKNKASGKYLQEFFDIESGPLHRNIVGISEPKDGYAKFYLDASFQTPTDYSGEYLIQSQGSGRYLYDDGDLVSTLVQEDGNSSRFVLKKIGNERYEIWNRASLRRVHYQYNGPNDYRFTTANADVQERDYECILFPKDDGSFTLRWGSGSLNVYEELDLNYGVRHRRLHRTDSWSVPDEAYSRFRLINPTDFNAEYEDLSGEYLIRVQGSGRYLNASNSNNTTADNLASNGSPSRFVLRRRMDVQEFKSGVAQPFFYEIWSKETGKRLRQVPGGSYKPESGAPLGDYLFRFARRDDGSYQITHKNTGQKLFEHFEPGTVNDKKLRSGGSIGNHYANFLLDEPVDVSLNFDDLSGAYSIMGKNSQRYWQDNNSANSPVFSSQPTLSGERNRFTLQKQSNNNYILKDPWGEVVKFSQGNFFGDSFFTRNVRYGFSGLKIINNEDGSVKFRLHYRADLWPLGDDNKYKFMAETSSTVQLGTTPNDFFLMPEPTAAEGAALDFDGVNDYVELANESNFDFTSAVTIEAWIKVDAFDKPWQAIVTKGDNAWRLHRYGNTNKIAFGTNGLSNIDLVSNTSVDDSQWHHIAAVYDGDYKYLYVDGVLDAEVAAIGTISSNDFKVQIGENAQQRNRYFNGRIDEVYIWNIARSQLQVQNNMVQNLTGSENGLAAYYDFNNGTPCGDNRDKTALSDQSSSGNNATLINFGLRSDECPSNWVQNYEPTPPPDLSDAYYLQVRGSGHYLDIRGDGVAVANSTSNTPKKFLLKKQGDGVYEIIYNGSRLHAEETEGKWTYTTTAATGLAGNYYQFKLIPSTNNSYKIKCLASQNYIFEHFDLNQNAPEHQQLLSASNEPGDYGYFELKNTSTASPENLSGEYLFKVTDSGRYMHCSGLERGGLLSTKSQANDDHIRFVLKRQVGGEYEIWSKANEQRLHASRPGLNWMFTTKEEDGLTEEHYLFSLTASSGFYTIKSIKINEYLYENGTRGVTSLASPTTNHLIELASTYVLPNDMSGEYFLRGQGSGRHLYNAGQRMETSAEISNNSIQFLLEKQSDGSYKIQSKGSLGYLHLAAGGVYSAAGNGEGNACKFNLIFDASKNGYRLQCKANNEYLYEYFDLALGGQHQQILSSPDPDTDYSYFFLESEYETPPEDLSGRRYIVSNSTGRHLFRNNKNKIATALPTADSESLRFVLKRRANGKYEVWNKVIATSDYKSVHVKTTIKLVRRRMRSGVWMPFPSSVDHFTALSNASSNEGKFLFDFSSQGDGVYRIINMSQGPLNENSSNVITTGATELFRLDENSSNVITTGATELFRLETSFEVDGLQSRK